MACIKYMRPTATDVMRSVVCVSVFLFVEHTLEPSRSGSTNPDAIWEQTCVGSHFGTSGEVGFKRRQSCGV